MYVNDLPPASQFQTTLFANDTYLTMAKNSLAKLESKVNHELLQIDTKQINLKFLKNSSEAGGGGGRRGRPPFHWPEKYAK